jgi:hypothetical protein
MHVKRGLDLLQVALETLIEQFQLRRWILCDLTYRLTISLLVVPLLNISWVQESEQINKLINVACVGSEVLI